MILHVIVADVSAGGGHIIYRRERLARYLSLQSETTDIFWVSTPRAAPESVPSSGRPARVHEFPIDALHPGARYAEPLQTGSLRRLVEAVKSHPAERKFLWYTVPHYSSLLRAVEWDATIYDCSDYWSGHPVGRSPLSMLLHYLQARSERRIIAGCDVLFASSTYLKERLSSAFGRDAELVENGVDFEAFFRGSPRPISAAVDLPPRPRLAFVGPLKSYKVDVRLLASIAASAPDWNLMLVGPTRGKTPQVAALIDLPNVYDIGYYSPEHVPSLMRRMDIGLLPYLEEPYNEGVFPLKLFEYLAAGLPVVGCGIPSTRHYAEEGVYAYTNSAREDFLEGCRMALSWQTQRKQRIALARANDWDGRFESIYRTVLEHVARASG